MAKLSDIFKRVASKGGKAQTSAALPEFALTEPVKNGNLEIVKKLLEAGADPNLRQSDDPQQVPCGDISVLKPAKVRRRTPEEREIALVRPVKIKNRTRDHA